MPEFEATVWVSGQIPYTVETNAANVFEARKIIARREGVSENSVQRIFQVQESHSSSSSSSSSGSSGTSLGSVGFLFGLLVLCFIIKFWYFFLAGAIIIGLLYTLGRNS
jgi:hypothetical protein